MKDFKDFKGLSGFDPSKIKLELPNLKDLPQPNYNAIKGLGAAERAMDQIRAQQRQREEREDYKISLLESINDNLSVKLDEVNRTLDIILSSIGSNFQRVQAEQLRTNEKLAELNALVAKKDNEGIRNFIQQHGLEGIALVLQFIGILTGTQSPR